MKHLTLLLLLLLVIINLQLKSQNTYYWVHNDLVTTGNEYSKDQVNATNTGAGTSYWKHFSKVSGSTSTANLVPAATPITSLDNIIVDNNSTPTRTVVSNYVVNIDNTGGGLICQDFDASTWNPPAGQLQRLSVNIITNLQVYRHFRMSPSDRCGYLQGTTLTFPNNSAAAVDSIHLYNTTQAGGNTFRFLINLNINILTNGKVYFCDTIRSSTTNGPTIVVRANDNIGLTNEVHFLENVSSVNSITAEAGNLYFHKNVTYLGSLRVGGAFGGGNPASPNTVNSRFYAHAPGYYSSPGVWNAGYWNDPAYAAQGQNVWTRLKGSVINRGIADFQNTRMNDVTIGLYGNKGRGTIGSDSVNFITNQTSYLRFRSAASTFIKPLSLTSCICTGYNHKGTWVIDQNPVVDNVTDYFSKASPQFYHDTFDDTLLVATNINGFGGQTPYNYSITIGSTGYAKFAAGYSYNFDNPDYPNKPLNTIFTNNGKLIIGDSKGCDSTATKLFNANMVIGATGTHTIANTQIEASKIQGTVAGRTILGSNTDMGGNTGFLFSLTAGQVTLNGVAPSTAAYAYGTAPYNSIPFTGKGARTLIWDDVASGSVNKYWSEKKWADAAISSTTFNQCPPTFIDSVIVNPGSTLKIDQRATQCKSFVALAGAPTTLSQKVTNSADSLSTLQIFGSFILNQKLNNMLNRNIMFRAWQTYPQIKTSGTNFWRGLNFYAINTGTANPSTQTNPGSWTLMDSLCAYNQNIIFTPRSNSAPDCKKINFDKITYALNDPVNEFVSPGGNNTAVSVYFNYMLYLTAGNLYSNNKNIHTYNFYIGSDARLKKKLILGSSTFNLYDGTGECYNVSTANTVYPYSSSWVAPDVTNSFTLNAGTSHIKFHTKTFMVADVANSAGGNNATTNSFGSKGNRYYDVSFLCNDSTNATYLLSTNILSAPILTVTAGAGNTRSGIVRSVNCNYRNITVWSSDASYPQIQSYRDTISKVTFKYTFGSLNSAAITTGTIASSNATPMSATVTNSSIDSLIFETKTNSINANAAMPGSGLYNIKRYLYFSPGSTNTFNPGDKHRIYNSSSVILTRKPWQDNTPAVPTDNPGYVAPAPYTAFTWAPYGAKVKSQAVCDAPTIVKFGGFTNAGNAVTYPTPYHWIGAAPRDTFDIKNWIVIDDSLTQFQTVDASVNLSGSTLNWDAGLSSPRTLIFRDGGVANASWFDKTKWAKVISYSPYVISAVGECIPQCGDSVIFDNSSFSAPTNSCSLGASNSAYCGTMFWKTGVTGNFDGTSTSVLTICNSLYFNTTMSNRFQGQTVFTAIDSNKVEYIQSGNKVFNNQVLFNQRNPSKYKTGWKLLDSLSTLPIANAVIPAMKINAGIVDTRGKNLNLTGGFDINGTKNRGINFHNSKVYTTGGRPGYLASGNQVAFNIDGDYTKLFFKADSSDIYATTTASTIPTTANYNAHFYVWNGLVASPFYTTTPKGFKFNKITVTAMMAAGSTSPFIHLRSDTVNTLTLNGKTIWYHFYKGYVKTCISNNPTTGPFQSQIGNATALATPLFRFNKGRIDTFRITHRVAATSGQFVWDTLYVKNEMTVQPGSSVQFAKGGLTWFGNKCNVQIVGTGALPISLNTNASIGTTYNYPAPTGNRMQNEHYFRKDSGTVCTDYAQLYNIWGIGNGNGNNSCVGGASSGCANDPVANSSAYGTWMAPVMSPTLGVRTLSDTTFYSSETPSFATAGRARFLAGNNADFGYPDPVGTHNTAGWDGSPYAGFPPTQLTLSQYTVCPGTMITASLALTGSLKGKDFPITATYSVGGIASAYTFTSSTSSPYTFTFAPTATTNTNVTWVDMSNTRCFNSTQVVGTSANITVLQTPTVGATASGTVACAGALTTLSASGAVSYTWSTGQQTSSISVNPTSTTVYSVVGTNTVGCYNTPPITLTVNVNALPTMSVGAQTNVSCFGLSTGAVTLTPVGGSGSGYSIMPTSTVNLAAGNYTYTVVDGANCTSTVVPITITQPAAALTAVNSSTNNTNCVTPNGQLTVNPSGGTSNYTYSWQPGGENTQAISGKAGNTYSVTVTDANLCTYTTQATITNPSGPVISASSSTNTICSGNGVTITPAGATTYTIVPSVGTATGGITGATVFTPTTATSYSVVGTDATSCLSNTVSLNIIVNQTPTVTISGVSNSGALCSGGSATITPSGAANYTLTNTGITGTSFTVNPASTTTYSIVGSATNCTGNTANTTVTVNPTPTVAIAATSGTLCSGQTTTLTAATANSYGWSTGGSGSTINITPLTNTVITVTGTNAAGTCTATAQYSITVNPTPTVAISATSGTLCSGQTATLTAATANSYGWSTGATGNAINITPLTNTVVTVTGTSAAGSCTATTQYSITVNPTPTVAISATSGTLCSGQTTTLTAATANSYGWSTGATGNTINITPLTNTVVIVTGTNTAGTCTASAQYSITVSPTPTLAISAVSSTLCSGQTTTLTAATANTYNWSTGATGNSINITPLTNTVVTVTGTNTAGSCTATTQYSITVNPTPTVAIAATNGTLCSGQTATLTAATANSYGWSTGATGNSINITPLTNTVITVTGTNAAGTCTATAQYSITVNSTPTVAISATSGTLCSGQTTTLTAATANSYGWSTGGGGSTINITPLTNTVVTVIGTNAAGSCTATAQYSITVNPTPTVAIAATNGTLCSGQTTTLTAATANSYGWSTGATGSTINITPLTNTVITVTGTNTAGTCTATAQYSITVNSTPTVAIAATNGTLCSGQTTTLTAATANSYGWSTGATGNSINITPLTNTVITVTGTNAAGSCTATAQYSITVNPTPTVTIAATSGTLCSGQTTTLTAVTANSYGWSTGATGNTINITPLTNTVITVTGTNTAGTCTASAQYSITVNSTPTVAIAASNGTLCAGQTTTLTAATANTYNWSTGATGNSINITPLTNTVITVTGTNATGGCTATAQYSVQVNPLPSLATTTVTNVSCFGLNNGSATFTTSAATYTLAGNNVSGTSATGLAPGSYTYTVTDANACNNTVSLSITQPTVLSSNAAITGSNTSCSTANGTASITIAGGTPSYTVNWDNGAINNSNPAGALNTGPHTYTVTDNHNCTINSGTLNMPGVTGINTSAATQSNVACFNGTSGAATFTTSGGSAYSYTLAGTTTTLTATNGTFSGLSSGTYSVHVLETNSGCVDNAVVSISQPTSAVIASAVQTGSVLCFGNTATVSVIPSGGTPNYTVTWQNSVATGTLTSYAAGTYTVNVSDANGCVSSTQSFVVSGPTQSLTATVTNTLSNTSCTSPNGSFTVTAVGGTPVYTYNTTNTSGVFPGQSTGSHVIVVTDANACTYTLSSIIPGVPTPSVVSSLYTNVLCSGGNTGSAAVTVSGGTTPYTYTWTGGSSAGNTLSNLTQGSYTVTVSDAGNCIVTKTFLITEPFPLNAVTTDITSPCVGQSNGSASIEVTGGTPNYTYVWNNNGSVNNTISGVYEGQYTATITDANGCKYQYPLQITAADGVGCTIKIPELYSPNGDGKNDSWEIKGLNNYPNNNVQVFNRWGDEVFKAQPYNNDWRGNNEGAKSILGQGTLPVGTYYFILDLGNGDKPITGYVQLTK